MGLSIVKTRLPGVCAACCALKHTIEGDFNHVYVDEVKKLMDGNGGGRVSR